MQANYVSLNPTYAEQIQSNEDRLMLVDRRIAESSGGPYAQAVGQICGITTALFFYVRAQKSGFPGFFPLQRVHAGQYGLILGMGWLAYNFASSAVSNITGDDEANRYLRVNKYKIAAGNASLDKQ